MNHVSWSPDGTKLAYAWSGDLYVMNADGSNKRRLTDSTAGVGNYYPTWSPDGSTIAYWRGSRNGRDGGPFDSEIYTIPAGGGAPTRLTHNDVSNIEPAWSPSGTQIAYRNGGELWVMQADGGNAHRLVRENGGAWAPAWSPDGTRIAFLRFAGNPSGGVPLLDVRVLDLGSGKITNVGVQVATDLNGPSWASDTTLLINRYD
jgi:Tol biopolymer transport system component